MSLQNTLERNGPKQEPCAVPCVTEYLLLIPVFMSGDAIT